MVIRLPALVIGLGLAVLSLAAAQKVDRDEFADILNKTVNFTNYSGAYDRIDTVEAIQGIGRSLATGLVVNKASERVVNGLFRVYHVVGDPKEKGKAADIIEFLPGSSVDHIDNVRRIVAAYLQTAYQYDAKEAGTLAVFITVYNAVHRGNLSFFAGVYKAPVQKLLRADAAGIGLVYSEWPGKTQLVIPLGFAVNDKTTAAATAVSPKDLVTPEVVATVRDNSTKSIQERKDLATIIDKSVDKEQAVIDKQKAEIAAREAALKEAEARAAKNTSQPAASNPASTPAPADARTTNANPTAAPSASSATGPATASTTTTPPATTKTPTELAAERQQLNADKEALARREAENKTASDTSQALRTTTATDIQANTKTTVATATPVLFPITRLEGGLALSKIKRINPNTGEVLLENADLDVVGHQIMTFNTVILVVAKEKVEASLAIVALDTLKTVAKSEKPVSALGDVQLLTDTQVLAVVQDGGEWYLGLFNNQLKLLGRSALPVDPLSSIKAVEAGILVQRKDGRPTVIPVKELAGS